MKRLLYFSQIIGLVLLAPACTKKKQLAAAPQVMREFESKSLNNDKATIRITKLSARNKRGGDQYLLEVYIFSWSGKVTYSEATVRATDQAGQEIAVAEETPGSRFFASFYSTHMGTYVFALKKGQQLGSVQLERGGEKLTFDASEASEVRL